MSKTVLILGARGRFGLSAARAFSKAGWQVIGQMRQGSVAPKGVSPQDATIRWVAADLYDAEVLSQAASGASVVVHALNPAYTNQAWREEVLPMMDATIAVARALGATVMMPGNVYNYGASMPPVVTEDTPQLPDTVKGHLRTALEAHLMRSGARAIVVRAGDFFGAGTGTWLDKGMLNGISKGRLTYPGHRHVATAWAYLPDLARTFVAIAERRAQLAAFEVFHFAGHSLSGQQWLDVIEPLARRQSWLRAGAELKFSRLPWPVIRLGALFNPTWAALAEMRHLWDTPHALSNSKLKAFIGEEPHTPLPAAVEATLTELGFIEPQNGPFSGAKPAPQFQI